MKIEIILTVGVAWALLCTLTFIFLYRHFQKKETIIATIMRLINRAVMVEIKKQEKKEMQYSDFEKVIDNYIMGCAKLKRSQPKEKKEIKKTVKKENKSKKEKKKIIRKEINY